MVYRFKMDTRLSLTCVVEFKNTDESAASMPMGVDEAVDMAKGSGGVDQRDSI